MAFHRGAVALKTDASTPEGLVDQIHAKLAERHDCHLLRPGLREPVAALAEELGTVASLKKIIVEDRIVVADLEGSDVVWESVANSVRAYRNESPDADGLRLLLVQRPGADDIASAATHEWHGVLRTGDIVVWAELCLPLRAKGLQAALATAMARHLCGWRLDLVTLLCGARFEDIADPRAWLSRIAEEMAAGGTAQLEGRAFACPLSLATSPKVIAERVWKAQLSVLFPLLEEVRQHLLARYGSALTVDLHARHLGVISVEELELGAIRHQVAGVAPRSDIAAIERLAQMRNTLAHRSPINADDVAFLSSWRDRHQFEER